MPFVYRLQKILDFRIRKKEEQLLVVQDAQKAVAIAERNIRKNNQEIVQVKINRQKADFRMMERYDQYLHHLWEKAVQLEEVKKEKQAKLKEEMDILVEREKEVKVLEKHKEKNKEIYKEEEKAAELKTLSETAIQRFFQQSTQKNEEEMLLELEKLEGSLNNEY